MPTQDCPKLSTDANLPPKAHAQSQRRRAGIRQFDNSAQQIKTAFNITSKTAVLNSVYTEQN
jgi:hypothetical protein